MSLQVRLALEGSLAKFTQDVSERVARASKIAIVDYGTKLKQELRDDTTEGGLGEGVANAWQLKEYDNAAGAPAVLVYSKAPLIVTAFGGDTTIVPKDGHLWLAIPTDNVPRIGNKRMSPVDVEARFGQPLIFKPGRSGVALAFVSVVPAKSGKGFRAATKGRAVQGRKAQLVLMFVMVRQVHLRKRLNWPELMASAEQGFQDYYGARIASALED
jgi:hypothetical protein